MMDSVASSGLGAEAGDGAERPVMSDGGVGISDLAREFGVSLRTLRFYEDKGLLNPRRIGTARIYSSRDREQLSIILQGKKLGFTLTEIRSMIDAKLGGEQPRLKLDQAKCLEQIALLERQRAEIDAAIAELRRAGGLGADTRLSN